MNEVTNMVFVCEMDAHFLCMYPHLMVTFMCMCHILSNIFTQFSDHIFVWGERMSRKRKVMTSGVTACIFIYRMVQEERSMIWDVLVSVSVRKKVHMNMCLILNGCCQRVV